MVTTGVIARPTLEQALRTLGVQLDGLDVPDACFTIAPDGITVETENPDARQHYPWVALGEQAAALKQQRQDAPVPRPELDRGALTRWSILLRLVGTVLDSERVQTAAWRRGGHGRGPDPLPRRLGSRREDALVARGRHVRAAAPARAAPLVGDRGRGGGAAGAALVVAAVALS
jgi:hypothetical protein